MKAMDADGSLQAAFAKLDVDKSGYLDHKELRKALASVGMALDSSKVRVRLRVRVRIRVRDRVEAGARVRARAEGENESEG